jgi:hypothetical protein
MSDDWRTNWLPDGRRVEFMDARWDDAVLDDDPPGSIGVLVTVAVEDQIETHRIVWTSERLEQVHSDLGM